MAEDYKAQVSIKFGPNQVGMINLRANSCGELEMLCNEAEETVVGSLAGLVEALGQVSGALPQPSGSPYMAPEVKAQFQGGHICPHGQRVYREGDGWKGWFCPAPKTEPSKCKPQYER